MQPKPYDQLVGDLEVRSYEMALIDIDLSETPDPDPYQFWAESQIEAGQNYAQWQNTTASTYLEQARQTSSIELRKKLYRNFQVLFDEELPSLPLFFIVCITMLSRIRSKTFALVRSTTLPTVLTTCIYGIS